MKKITKKYTFAVIATDVVIFTIQDGQLKVLLIQMKKVPFTGQWAIPGGLVKPDESVDNSARRQLVSKTGVSDIYLEQLYTFGEVNRDPFGRVVSVAYFALIPYGGFRLKTTKEYEGVDWFGIKMLPGLAYDHAEIISSAVERLKSKLAYTNIVYSLLPNEFALGELQQLYEIILDKKFDRRNFRRKILSLNLLKKLGKKRGGDANRPAELYSFVKRKPAWVQVL